MDAHSHFEALSHHIRGHLESAFPAAKKRRAESFLTDATWVLRGQRIWLRKRTACMRRRAMHVELWSAFLAWRRRRPLGIAKACAEAWIVGAAREAAAHVLALRASKKDLRMRLRQDRLQWIHRLAATAGDVSTKHVVQRLRPLLGPPRRRARAGCGLPAVARLDGSLAQDPDEVRERWIEHFSANEGGHRCSTEALAGLCQARQRRQRLEVPAMAAEELPSRLQLEDALRRSATGRAVGPDGVPAELLHFGAGSIAAPIYQLLLKTVLTLEEPLAFKGGLVHHLWKGKTAPHLCHSHRAILISSTVHRTLRGLGLAPFLQVHSPLQVGGLPRHPVLTAAHAARLFASYHRRGNCFLLFLDLREAFYRVARPLLVDMRHSEADVARVFRELQLPPEAFQAFRQNLGGQSATSQAGASEWMQAMFRELLSNTWFRLPHQSDVVATDLGTRPGDNLADLLFSYLFAAVLAKVKQSLLSEGIDVGLGWSERMRGSVVPVPADPSSAGVCLTDCTWMDDMCLMVSTRTATDLFPTLRFAAGVLLDQCLSHGMTPNLDKGKSEVIVMVHRKGSRAVRRQYLSSKEPTVECAAQLWNGAGIRVASCYRHLGGMLTHKATCEKEIRSRVGQAWSAFNKHKKQVFSNPIVPVADKVAIYGSVVLSVLLYGAGAWTGIAEADVRILDTAYVAMARCMLRKHLDPLAGRISGARVLAQLGMPSVAILLHAGRLSYLTSFLCLDIPCLWALAHAEKTWLQHVAASLQWLWEEVDNGSRHATWQSAWDVWRLAIPVRKRCGSGLCALPRSQRAEGSLWTKHGSFTGAACYGNSCVLALPCLMFQLDTACRVKSVCRVESCSFPSRHGLCMRSRCTDV